VPLVTVSSPVGTTVERRWDDVSWMTLDSGSFNYHAGTPFDPIEQITKITGPRQVAGSSPSANIGCYNFANTAATGVAKVTNDSGATTATQSFTIPPHGFGTATLAVPSDFNLSVSVPSSVPCAARTSDDGNVDFSDLNIWMRHFQ
jgi:hypothetical protein